MAISAHLDIIRPINKDTFICKDYKSIFVAKREWCRDEDVAMDRINLINHLNLQDFPTPKLYNYNGSVYDFDHEGLMYYQEFIDFPRSFQRDSFSRKFLIDAVKLLVDFQEVTKNFHGSGLDYRYYEYFNNKLKKIKSNDGSGGANQSLLKWLDNDLKKQVKLDYVQCHGSYRHHNLYYRSKSDVMVVDFFHNISCGPRIYDLCLLFTQFGLGSKAGLSVPLEMLKNPRVGCEQLYAGLKWGFYSEKLIEDILCCFRLSADEEDHIIPIMYLIQLKNNAFSQIISKPLFEEFIKSLSNVLNTKNHPL